MHNYDSFCSEDENFIMGFVFMLRSMYFISDKIIVSPRVKLG